MSVTAKSVAAYLAEYAAQYREEYDRLTAAGFPQLHISPYLESGLIQVWLSAEGVVLMNEDHPPAYQWWITGGPTLMTDFPETRTPVEVVSFLKANDLWGKDIGIYRIVSKIGIPDDVWRGRIDTVEEVYRDAGNLRFVVRRTPHSFLDLLRRLTFGAFGLILDLHLPGQSDPFWFPRIVRRMGFMTADRVNRRYVNYMEISSSTAEAAWDTRNIAIRVQHDVRRDFASAVKMAETGATIDMGGKAAPIEPAFFDRLRRLHACIENFRDILGRDVDISEDEVHQFLVANAILLDVYADAESKPRFKYPEGDSPLGKAYVEPDFILKYPDKTYKLVELERPKKPTATVAGQPRAEVTQAAFQIAEWRDYIAHHYDLIKDRFPGIATQPAALVVISRTTSRQFGGREDINRWKELLRQQYATTDFLTYDELLDRARSAYARLAAIH